MSDEWQAKLEALLYQYRACHREKDAWRALAEMAYRLVQESGEEHPIPKFLRRDFLAAFARMAEGGEE